MQLENKGTRSKIVVRSMRLRDVLCAFDEGVMIYSKKTKGTTTSYMKDAPG